LFAGLARGFQCQFERGIGDYVVDSHREACLIQSIQSLERSWRLKWFQGLGGT
jgi:hypothetical protein